MLAVCVVALLAACQAAPPAAAPPAGADAATDECAARLHDLAGQLLQHYVQHAQLPPTLAELVGAPGAGGEALRCPVSQRPYVYAPAGLQAPGQERGLILFDAAPAHAGRRWAIMMSAPEGDQPLGLWVVQLTEAELARFRRM